MGTALGKLDVNTASPTFPQRLSASSLDFQAPETPLRVWHSGLPLPQGLWPLSRPGLFRVFHSFRSALCLPYSPLANAAAYWEKQQAINSH